MVTLCWAVKGGSGTTVVAATLALESRRPSLLVDLAGEAPAMLGMSEPDGPGVLDWLGGDGPAEQLADLVIDIDDHTALLPHRLGHSVAGAAGQPPPARWAPLVAWLEAWEQSHGGDVWIDGGTGTPPAALADVVPARWLVTRACYLSLRRAAGSSVRPTGVILVVEPGRALRPIDVERSLGADVVVSIDIDPKVARSIDAGLLASRPPRTIRRGLRRVAA